MAETKGDTGDTASSAVDPSVVIEEEEHIENISKIELDEEEEERESWGNKCAYILTLVGYAVGFGNIWRFPYLMQENGGVAFLVPYSFMLFFLGIPTFFLELAIGQRLRKGPIGTWNEISPYLAGIGLMSCSLCLLVGCYYTTLIAWCLTYLFDIFRQSLRWSDCDRAVSNDVENVCTNQISDGTFTRSGFTFEKACELCKDTGASQYYWYYEILNASNNIEEPGNYNLWISLYLVVSWILVWAIIVKGLKVAGKVVYFTALFPYIVLTIFLICGLTLHGTGNGFKVLFTPDWSKLSEGKVWMAAGTQIFFSLGLGFGCLIAFASYLPSNNDCYTDALRVALINCSTSLFASLVIFSILGFQGTRLFDICKEKRLEEFRNFLKHDTKGLYANLGSGDMVTYDCDGNLDTDELKGVIREFSVGGTNYSVPLEFYDAMRKRNLTECSITSSVKSSAGGTGLVFVVFADAMVQLPVPQLFAFLFYMMLFTLGIDSAFGTIEGAMACLADLRLNIKRWLMATIICGGMIVVSQMFAFGWGVYLLTFFDEFTANWCLLVVAFFECIGISFVYGLKQFSYDIKLMTGRRPNVFLMFCWKIASPIIMVGIMVASIIQYATTGLNYDTWNLIQGKTVALPWPSHVVGIGFAMTFFAMMWIPLFAILRYFNIQVLREEVPAYFPEAELREERNIVSDEEEEKSHTAMEKLMFWGSQTELRRKSRSPSVGGTSALGSDSEMAALASLAAANSANQSATSQ